MTPKGGETSAGFEAEADPNVEQTFGASVDLASAFRDVLRAMAQPATPVRLKRAASPPAPLSSAAATCLRVLADQDARVWLAPSHATPTAEAFVRFHLGAAPAPEAALAAFCCGRWPELIDQVTAQGDPERPDLSATLIVEVDGFEAPGGHAAEVSGPGLATRKRLAVTGVDQRFWPFVASNATQFPLGVDILLCARDEVVGLPRSVRVAPLDGTPAEISAQTETSTEPTETR